MSDQTGDQSSFDLAIDVLLMWAAGEDVGVPDPAVAAVRMYEPVFRRLAVERGAADGRTIAAAGLSAEQLTVVQQVLEGLVVELISGMGALVGDALVVAQAVLVELEAATGRSREGVLQAIHERLSRG